MKKYSDYILRAVIYIMSLTIASLLERRFLNGLAVFSLIVEIAGISLISRLLTVDDVMNMRSANNSSLLIFLPAVLAAMIYHRTLDISYLNLKTAIGFISVMFDCVFQELYYRVVAYKLFGNNQFFSFNDMIMVIILPGLLTFFGLVFTDIEILLPQVIVAMALHYFLMVLYLRTLNVRLSMTAHCGFSIAVYAYSNFSSALFIYDNRYFTTSITVFFAFIIVGTLLLKRIVRK